MIDYTKNVIFNNLNTSNLLQCKAVQLNKNDHLGNDM